MRTFLCILLMGWMWLPFAARAQNPTITAAEYFLDADPGVGSGKSFPVPASANPSVQTQVSLQGLALGFHTLSVRFKDSNDFWSVARTRVFLIESPVDSEEVSTVVSMEYFINTDPGPGNGTKTNITPGAEASLAIPVSLSGFPEGFHNIAVRFQDQSGKWSTARSRIFFIQNSITDSPLLPITAAEYFIDNDPGPGLGKSLSVNQGPNPQVLGNISLTDIQPGFHNIGVRFKSQDNIWGLARSSVFYVNDENFGKPTMVDYVEYFFDGDDPGEGNATSITLDQPASAISVEALIAVADLSQGTHSITVRIRDTQGIWSPVVSKEFIVGEPQFTVPPKPDLAELPTLEDACAINLSDLTAPTATAEDGSKVIGTADESLFPITKQGSSEIIWTFTDISGLKSTQKQLVVIEDKEAPEISIPGRIVLNASADQCVFTNVDFSGVTATDNCGEPTLTNNAPENFGFGITVVTWTATDAAGNQVQSTQEVEVIDNIAPSITAPADLVIELPAGSDGIESININLGSPLILENCGLQLLENNAPVVFEVGSTNVTWTAVDLAGNTGTALQNVIITTEVLPTILAPAPLNVSTDAGSCFATVADLGTPSVTGENIPNDGISNDAPATFPIGTTVVTWTVTDGKGNIATATQEVTVTDPEPPTITAPAAVTVLATLSRCDASDVALGQPTVADNCGIKSITNNAPELFPFGNTTVTWTVEDLNGNVATASQIVTVTEDQEPLITAPADLLVQIAPDADSATVVALGQAEASDNCGIDKIENNAPTVFPLGVTVVTWTVSDISGNTASAEQIVTVTREILPTITAPPAITVNNDPGTCGASGIELGTPSVTGEDIPADGITNTALETYPVGTTNVVWTVIDGRGNTATAIQTVTVVDKEAPTIIAPPTVNTLTVANGCESGEIDLGEPKVSDNCEVLSFSNNAPEVFPLGTSTVIWTVIDVNGNEATAEQTVIVVDEELPLITAPANITIRIEADEDSAEDVELGQPTVSDNCSIDEVSNNALGSFPVGTTTVIWTVRDGSGNEATAEQTVTVTREVLPTITAPPAITVNNDPGTCGASAIELGTPTVTGEDIPSDGISNNAPATFPVGNTQITWTATDASGNTATASQTVRVEDNEAPQISAPANISIQLQAGEESATDVELGTPTTSDNCGVAEVTNDAPTSFPIGTTIVIWTVTDVNSNTATDTQSVTVIPADTETDLPTVSAPADILVDTDKGICEANNVDLGIATFTGDIPDGGLSNDAPTSFTLGETIVTWTVTDRSGNSATAVQKVTVRDRELPDIKAPANLVLSATSGGISSSEVDLGEPEVSDNCSIAEVRNNAPAVFPIGTTTVTWTVIDGSGNICTAKQRVTVNLIEGECEVTAKAKPVVTLKLNSQGKARLNPDMADDGSTAFCGPLKLDLSKCDFTCEDIGENSVKLIAKDAKGNRDEVEFKVILVDETKPKIKVEKKAFVWMMKKGDTFTMPDFKDRVEASDNCGFELHQCPEPGTKFRKPENSFVEFEAKDPSGNKATDKFKFNLLVFKCKVPNKNGRTTGEQELSDMLIVPWNTSFDKAISEGIVFEEGSDPEYI
ncbi:HYR domain-containing protein, partial [Aquiflexum lacus]|uniref:HYR domain-containing protein n=1 Tax=Aquiflexum lacus TaxID=2483805 RepID=UPI001892D34C